MKRLILIVDDEPDACELAEFVLKAEGYETITAKDGLEALKKTQTFSPDLILLDLMMPELDGISVCEILKRNPATATIPIIMLTAWSSNQARTIGLLTGAKHYLTKPFSPRELVFLVKKELLDSSR